MLTLPRAHNPEVAGSNPTPATMKTRLIGGFFVSRHLGLLVHKFTLLYNNSYLLEGAMKNILLIALLNHPEYAELDWEKVNFSKNAELSARFDALVTKCQ